MHRNEIMNTLSELSREPVVVSAAAMGRASEMAWTRQIVEEKEIYPIIPVTLVEEESALSRIKNLFRS